jgi:N-methylhydantoinase B
VTNPSQNLSNTPIEILEAQHPVRVEEYAFIPDSCGAGKFRGGLGIAREYVLLDTRALLQLRSDRVTHAPYGLAGGRPGRATRNVFNPQDGGRIMPSKFALDMQAGDVIRHEQAGGGGYGDPLERDPERVAADVRDGKITLGFALSHHGVVMDTASLTIDHARTRQQREVMARAGIRH